MRKEKYHIEYIFDKVSNRSLWNHLTTPMGLAAWFADEVDMTKDACTFTWNKIREKAEIESLIPEYLIRFRWLDEKEAEGEAPYFEFYIHDIELTGATSLEITDFAEPGEKADAIALWDSQVETLKRSLGIHASPEGRR
ncbi:MAG: hypothetical protein LBD27_05310 [Tannerella sp.]|jgi:uncharacterized protein YndB with AHSA1/START domain|nr:hypothetical protein [Tannerella sp.]